MVGYARRRSDNVDYLPGLKRQQSRGGFSKVQLGVASAMKDERQSLHAVEPFNLADEDQVITTGVGVGLPAVEASQAVPEKRQSFRAGVMFDPGELVRPLEANRSESLPWSSASTCTTKRSAPTKLCRLKADLASDHNTIGGSRDSELKLLAVTPEFLARDVQGRHDGDARGECAQRPTQVHDVGHCRLGARLLPCQSEATVAPQSCRSMRGASSPPGAAWMPSLRLSELARHRLEEMARKPRSAAAETALSDGMPVPLKRTASTRPGPVVASAMPSRTFSASLLVNW